MNWSQIAQDAFTQKLGEIAAAKPVMDLQDVLARLRASKLRAEDETVERIPSPTLVVHVRGLDAPHGP